MRVGAILPQGTTLNVQTTGENHPLQGLYCGVVVRLYQTLHYESTKTPQRLCIPEGRLPLGCDGCRFSQGTGAHAKVLPHQHRTNPQALPIHAPPVSAEHPTNSSSGLHHNLQALIFNLRTRLRPLQQHYFVDLPQAINGLST